MPAHPDTRQSLPGAPAQAASPFSLPSARFFWLLNVWVRAGGRDQTRKKQPKVIQTPEHNSFHRPRTLSLCRVSRGSAQANADSLTKVMRNRRGLLMRPIPVRTLTNEERKERLGLSQRFSRLFCCGPCLLSEVGAFPLRPVKVPTPANSPSARSDPQALKRAVFLDRAFFF